MSIQDRKVASRSPNWHRLELVAGLLLAFAAVLSLSGAVPLSGTLPWLFAAYGALLLIVEFGIRDLDEQINPILLACLTGYVAAVAVIGTRLAQGSDLTEGVWAASLAVFAALATIVAGCTKDKPMTAGMGAAVIAILVATAIAATIALPIIDQNDLWIYAIAIFVGTSITVLLLLLNDRIFDKRSEILQRLLTDLAATKPQTDQESISLLKLAAHKYHAQLNPKPGQETTPAPPPDSTATTSKPANRWPVAMSATAYLVFSIIGYVLLLTPTCTVFGGTEACKTSWITEALFWTSFNQTKPADLINTVAVAGAAFLGAHIFTLRYLFRAALNSELNQFKWIRAALHLLTGVIVGLVLYRTFKDTGWLKGAVDNYAPALWLGIAFVSGWIPDFALTTLLRQTKVRRLKSIDEEVLKLVSLVPVEIIDGIDYSTRYRLEENNIVDVQSLATYNPILLYVETPYGLAHVFDWVTQAQLCLVVGPRPYIELKKVGIRTIFQLADEVTGEDPPAPYLSMVGNAMYASASAERLKLIANAAAADDSASTENAIAPAVVTYAVGQICADPYYRALRQLWEYIYADGPTSANPAAPA